MADSSKKVIPGGVDEYIAKCPLNVQAKLKSIRKAIQEVAPGAIETVSYFQIPGYSYEGYDYNGMFAWFSYKQPYIRLHVRPLAIEEHKAELKGCPTTKGAVSFPLNKNISLPLVKKLVLASLNVMKGNATKRE